MELFLEQIDEAKKALKVADHLTYVTFPLMGDDKIFDIITNNLQISLLKTLDALLNYEKYYKRISNVPEKFDDKLFVFKNDILKRYNLNSEVVVLIKEINDRTNKRKKIMPERSDDILFFAEKARPLNLKKVKDYINLAKLFTGRVNEILGKNARGF